MLYPIEMKLESPFRSSKFVSDDSAFSRFTWNVVVDRTVIRESGPWNASETPTYSKLTLNTTIASRCLSWKGWRRYGDILHTTHSATPHSRHSTLKCDTVAEVRHSQVKCDTVGYMYFCRLFSDNHFFIYFIFYFHHQCATVGKKPHFLLDTDGTVLLGAL